MKLANVLMVVEEAMQRGVSPLGLNSQQCFQVPAEMVFSNNNDDEGEEPGEEDEEQQDEPGDGVPGTQLHDHDGPAGSG